MRTQSGTQYLTRLAHRHPLSVRFPICLCLLHNGSCLEHQCFVFDDLHYFGTHHFTDNKTLFLYMNKEETLAIVKRHCALNYKSLFEISPLLSLVSTLNHQLSCYFKRLVRFFFARPLTSHEFQSPLHFPLFQAAKTSCRA